MQFAASFLIFFLEKSVEVVAAVNSHKFLWNYLAPQEFANLWIGNEAIEREFNAFQAGDLREEWPQLHLCQWMLRNLKLQKRQISHRAHRFDALHEPNGHTGLIVDAKVNGILPGHNVVEVGACDGRHIPEIQMIDAQVGGQAKRQVVSHAEVGGHFACLGPQNDLVGAELGLVECDLVVLGVGKVFRLGHEVGAGGLFDGDEVVGGEIRAVFEALEVVRRLDCHPGGLNSARFSVDQKNNNKNILNFRSSANHG